MTRVHKLVKTFIAVWTRSLDLIGWLALTQACVLTDALSHAADSQQGRPPQGTGISNTIAFTVFSSIFHPFILL